MTVCPVCETPAAPGTPECGVCGKQLTPTVAAAPPPPLAMLELDSGRAESVALPAMAVMAELDTGRSEQVGDVAMDLSAPIERAPDPVGEVAVQAVADVEQTRVADREWTPMQVGPRICRACRTPEPDDSVAFCSACAYKLPVVAVMSAELIFDGAPAKRAADVERVPCPACGTRSIPGELCSGCGAIVRGSSA